MAAECARLWRKLTACATRTQAVSLRHRQPPHANINSRLISRDAALPRILLTQIFFSAAAALAQEQQQQPAVAASPEATKASAQTSSGGGVVVQPLSAREKLNYGAREAFLRPESYIFTGLNAAITEATERDQPHKTSGDRTADGLTRFAINFGTRSARSLLGSGVYPVIFNQDPRYQPSPRKGFRRRTLYAASQVFVTEGARGQLQPNYSRLGGNISASALANLWERSTPGRDRIGVGPTFTRFGITLGVDVLSFVIFREFLPDIKRKLFNK
ncbi:MAG: hypothetical protein WKF30_10475 [Pyrinomonadaceae bacterium]